jgi:hypothetical protein
MTYNQIDHDELFEELLSNFSNCNIGNLHKKSEDVNLKQEEED